MCTKLSKAFFDAIDPVVVVKVECIDIVFFGMYLREYNEHYPSPNTRHVYIFHCHPSEQYVLTPK
ncbi:unnamed protein product, partial [Adineta steineri]